MTNANSDPNQSSPTPEDLDDKTVDPRDLARSGGFEGDPQEIVQNPAVSPQMLDEVQDSRDRYVWEDRDDEE